MDDYKKLKIMGKKFYRIGQRERNKELTLFPEKNVLICEKRHPENVSLPC
jgi:hypothetical protein